MRYIKQTVDLKLVYKKGKDQESIKGFVDSDWGGDQIDRKSTIGFCFQVYGCTVSWCTKKQPCVALSSTEAEYIALCAVYVRLVGSVTFLLNLVWLKILICVSVFDKDKQIL
jgi:hypothetical protein